MLKVHLGFILEPAGMFGNSSAVGKGPHTVCVCVCVLETESEKYPPVAFCHPPIAPTSGPVSFTVGDCLFDGFLMPLTLPHTHQGACTHTNIPTVLTCVHTSINMHPALIRSDRVHDQWCMHKLTSQLALQ